MNTREIEILLDKYFEGESTLADEKALKEFFNSGNVPGHLKEYTGIFGYFEIEKLEKIYPDFEEKILDRLSDHQIPFYQNRRFWYYFTGIAASLLFVFTILYESNFIENRYTQQEKQLAYNQTKQALAYVSGKINQGFGPLQEMNKISVSSIPLMELGKFEKNLMQLSNNMGKMERSVNNIKKISKFTIIVKP
jgi:hypothetical protein